MTENEAIGMLQAKLTCMELELLSSIENGCDNDCDACEYCYTQGTVGEQKKALEMAIQAIEENQKFHAVGTIEELKALKEKNETLKALYEDARKEGNNLIIKTREEAITEFAEKLRPRLNTLVDRLRLDEIASEMKGE